VFLLLSRPVLLFSIAGWKKPLLFHLVVVVVVVVTWWR